MRYYISQTPANPLSRILAAVVATVCLVGAFFFGLVILAVIAVVIAVFSLIFWLRILWLRRNAPPDQAQTASHQPGNQAGDQGHEVIEGEYTVVSERHD
jgi:hypothetical protein